MGAFLDVSKVAHRDERGASAVEYGLLAVAIAAIIVILVFALGVIVHGEFATSCGKLEGQFKTGTSCTP